jgi:high-affinity nickel-transport protein
MTLLSILVLGFFFGIRHATDSDHVIAVTTIVSRQRDIRSAAITGVFWGIGHSITLLVVGGAIILFGLVIPERLGLSLEFCVALMLILLGAFNLRVAHRALRGASAKDEDREFDDHPHRHGDYVHSHSHGHAPGTHSQSDDAVPAARMDRQFGRWRIYRALRPAIIGVVHGLAGSAAVALLVLPIIHNPIWAMMYLSIFGVGTIVGMMMITAAIAVPVSYTARFQFFHRHLGAVAGFLSLSFGLFLVYQIGFVDGLFR